MVFKAKKKQAVPKEEVEQPEENIEEIEEDKVELEEPQITRQELRDMVEGHLNRAVALLQGL